MKIEKSRNKYSVMKGLAITGVVAGHAGIDIVEIFVNYWHLPVFFFVSGYFLKEKHLDNWKGYVSSRAKRLLVPFFIYATVALLLHNILLGYGIISGSHYGVHDYVKGAIHLVGLSSYEQLIGAMWFLPALFIVSLVSLLLIKIIKNYKIGKMISGGVILVAIILCYLKFPSPYSIWQYISVSWVFIMGYFCSKRKIDDKLLGWYWGLGSLLLLSTALLTGTRVGMQASTINVQPIVYPLIFVAGIILINYVSHKITNTKVGNLFAIIGDFSFTIMALHFVGFKVVTFFRTLLDPAVDLSAFPVDKTDIMVWMPVYVIVGMAFPILILQLFNRLKNVRNHYSLI